MRRKLGDIGFVATGTALGQVASLVAAALAAVLYPPEALGIVGIVSGIGGIATIATAWRLEMGLPSIRTDSDLTENVRHLRGLARTFAWLSVGIAFIAWLAAATNSLDDKAAVVVSLVPLSIGALIYHDLSSFLAVRDQRFSIVGYGGFIQGVTQAIVLIVGGLIWPTAITAALSLPLSRGLAGAFMLHSDQPLSAVRPKIAFRSAFQRNKSHVAALVPSGIIVAIFPSLPTFTIATVLGLSQAGVYFTVQRLVAFPARLLSGAVSKVTYGAIGRNLDRSSVLSHVRGGLRITVPGAVLAVLGGLIASRVNFGSVLGSEWADIAVVILPIAVGASGQLVLAPFQFILISLSKHNLVLALHCTRLAFLAAACVIALIASPSLKTTAWLLGIAAFVGYVVMAAVTARVITSAKTWVFTPD